MQNLDFFSLFDGIGGFPLAWANLHNINHKDFEYSSSEVVPFLLNILDSNFPKVNQLNDITKLNPEELKDIKADIITMGTPCTGFSISGKRDGLENEESCLFSNGVDIINTIRPKYFVWENVFGVTSANDGKEFREILNQFKIIGYDLAWTILDSKYFGLPQNRRRVYLIGVRDGLQKNNNIFEIHKRQSTSLLKEIKELHFEHDFNKEATNPKDYFAFFNRQRSDKFKEVGVSNTLAKRDFKSATNLVVKNGVIRKVTPKERLRLQGIPDDWFDCTNHISSDKERYRANGMSVPVVEYVFKNLLEIENGLCYKDPIDYKKEVFSAESAFDIYKNKEGAKKEFKNIPNTGQMFLDRNDKNEVVSNKAEYHLVPKCAESMPTIIHSNIADFLEDNVDSKYHSTYKSCLGMLRREYTSKIPLPKKLREAIFHMYPDLIGTYPDL